MDRCENISTPANSEQNSQTPAAAASPDDGAADSAFNRRLGDWKKEASEHPDPRLACVGMLNAKTAKMVDQNAEAILRNMEQCKTSTLEEPAIRDAIAAHNGLMRQWNSMLNFQTRLEKMHQDAVVELKFDPLRQIPR